MAGERVLGVSHVERGKLKYSCTSVVVMVGDCVDAAEKSGLQVPAGVRNVGVTALSSKVSCGSVEFVSLDHHI